MLEPAASPSPDLAAVKARQQGAWSSGDYAVVGTTLQIVGEQLCEALELRPGSKVLDVAAGNGNVTLAAARRWCDVTSTDYVAALLERGRERAMAEGLNVEFREADAEALPFPDSSFDAVVSTFGVMFTPDQDKAAAEMLRVCKSGGKIGLANWTPDGFIGEVFKTLGRHVPPPAGVKSPALWGTRARLDEMFGAKAASITAEPRMFVFRYRSPQHWLDVFKTFYGPMLKAFAALDATAQDALRRDLLDAGPRFQPLGRRHDGGAERISRSRHQQALKFGRAAGVSADAIGVSHVETLIIGGGQAGLAMSHMLSQRGCPHLVLERHRIAERWQTERWKGLRFQFPNWSVRLPDFPFRHADPDGFAGAAEILGFVRAYAEFIAAPVRCGVTVTCLRRNEDRRSFVAETSGGPIEAANVVVATGPYQQPVIPEFAERPRPVPGARQPVCGTRTAASRGGACCRSGCFRVANRGRALPQRPPSLSLGRPSPAHAAALSGARPDLVAEHDGSRPDAGGETRAGAGVALDHWCLWRAHDRLSRICGAGDHLARPHRGCA